MFTHARPRYSEVSYMTGNITITIDNLDELYSEELLDAVLSLDPSSDKPAFFTTFRGRVMVVTDDDFTKSVEDRNVSAKDTHFKAAQLLRKRLIF
jgi:hypothetical protein